MAEIAIIFKDIDEEGISMEMVSPTPVDEENLTEAQRIAFQTLELAREIGLGEIRNFSLVKVDECAPISIIPVVKETVGRDC